MVARNEIIKKLPLSKKLRGLHPEMTQANCDAAICFESKEDLQSRWGEELFQ